MHIPPLREAQRVLKTDGDLVIVYAHKTTLGWTTLIEALRSAEFMVVEAWPLDTEMSVRLRAIIPRLLHPVYFSLLKAAR